MNSPTPRYPVDRYMVERSNKFEMVNIIDEDIWNAEPALRPEDEIILRKLHDMLQSTADDLKLLSGELSKYREPGVQVKSLPTPLDQDFNEKVHIEEIVNAKFHGNKIVDNSTQPTPSNTERDAIKGLIKSIAIDNQKPKKVISTGTQVSQAAMLKKESKRNNLTVSRTKNIQINDYATKIAGHEMEHRKQEKEKSVKPAVAYNEFFFKYEPKTKEPFRKPLQVQKMPSINIRSELKEQKVLNINIDPEVFNTCHNVESKNNISVISVQHGPTIVLKAVPTTNTNQASFSIVPTTTSNKEGIRKVSKMMCESSGSTNNINSIIHTYRELNPDCVKTNKSLPKQSTSKRKVAKQANIDEWKKKLNIVYGHPTKSKKFKSVQSENKAKKNETRPCSPKSLEPTRKTNTLNNAEYIPYSKLTLGGVRVSDIEKELSNQPSRNDIVLSPILDKILSRENSFQNYSPRDDLNEESPKILTTSDENLLREVLDIEKKVNKTSNNINDITSTTKKDQHLETEIDDEDTYIDDFEDEKSYYSDHMEKQNRCSDAVSEHTITGKSSDADEKSMISKNMKAKNTMFTKTLNLSFKNEIDIFEFVHSVDTQETGTQSNCNQKISLKETQTSPRNHGSNAQPIHNDLWPSIDPKGEVEKLFELEKDFIKKLIIDEYGDLLTNNLNKPSTSRDHHVSEEKNVMASQKNTQTSPAHVKSIMTSPTRTKTRTTSPFAMSLVDKQTSPIMIEELKINVEHSNDLDISINLSSPRFNLQLPESSRRVFSNLESHVPSVTKKHSQSNKNNTRLAHAMKKQVSSSSSVDGDYSSSDISSLGEVGLKLKKRLRKLQVPSISELSSSTSLSKYGSDISEAVIPLRSEGEVSLGQINRRKSTNNRSEGEMSLGRLY